MRIVRVVVAFTVSFGITYFAFRLFPEIAKNPGYRAVIKGMAIVGALLVLSVCFKTNERTT